MSLCPTSSRSVPEMLRFLAQELDAGRVAYDSMVAVGLDHGNDAQVYAWGAFENATLEGYNPVQSESILVLLQGLERLGVRLDP